MKLFNRHTLALAAALSLASPTLLHAAPKAPPPAEQTAQPTAAMDAQLFYEILVGEMAAQQGDYGNAYSLILDAARRTQSPKLFGRAAGIALAARDGQAALQALQAWRRTDPTSRDAARLELQALVSMHRMSDLVQPIRDTIDLSPEAEKPAAILALPVVFARTGDKALAVQITESALAPYVKRAETSSAAWVTIGRLRLGAGDSTGALQAAKTAQTADPKFDAPAILALELAEAGLDEAEPIIQRFLAEQTSTPVRLSYAKLLMDAKRPDSAFEQLQIAARQDPQTADTWLLMSDLHLQRKQPKEAEQALQKYLERAKQPGPLGGTPRGINVAALQLAEMAMGENRKQDARQVLGHIVSEELNLAQSYRLAKLQLDLGDEDAAWATLAQLPEETEDERKEKTQAKAQLMRESGKAQQAYTTLKTLLKRYPNDTDVLYDTAMAAEKAGDLAGMEAQLRRVIAIDPRHANAYNALGYSLADRNLRLNEARELIEAALRLSPDSLHIQDSLAWVEFRLGNHARALEMLERIYADFPDAEIAAHLGEVLWATGQRERAQAVWAEALKLDPRNTTLKDTMERLGQQRKP